MDLFTYLMKKKRRNSSVVGDLFSYLLANEGNGSYVNYTGETINVDNSVKARMKNWNLGGNTSQDGTPTPEAPKDIHVVKGENNVIENIGKNLFYPYTFTINRNGVEFISKDGYIEATGTATNDAYSLLSSEATDKLIELNAGTYCLSGADSILKLEVVRSNGQSIGSTTISQTYFVFTLFEDTKVFIRAKVLKNSEVDHVKIYPQLELGSTPTEYEKYKGKNYKISLSSKNYLNIYKDHEAGYTFTHNGITYVWNNDGTITANGIVTGNDNSRCDIGVSYDIKGLNKKLVIKKRSGTITGDNIRIVGYAQNWADAVASRLTPTDNEYINTLNDYIYNVFRLVTYVGTKLENVVLECMVVDSEITDYSFSQYIPPIELCKIGDYQDRIYKSNDKWYLEKNIRKILLNSNMNWFLAQTNTNTFRFGSTSALQNGLITNSIKIICNNFPNGTGTTDNSDNEHIRSAVEDYPDYLFINIDKTRVSDLTEFNEWLNNNETIVYYILNNPVITEITNEILLSQLNELAKAKSFNGQTNITQISEDLPFDLSVDIKTQ